MSVLDLEELERLREAAAIDKAELFDFYDGSWGRLLDEIERQRAELYRLEEQLEEERERERYDRDAIDL